MGTSTPWEPLDRRPAYRLGDFHSVPGLQFASLLIVQLFVLFANVPDGTRQFMFEEVRRIQGGANEIGMFELFDFLSVYLLQEINFFLETLLLILQLHARNRLVIKILCHTLNVQDELLRLGTEPFLLIFQIG